MPPPWPTGKSPTQWAGAWGPVGLPNLQFHSKGSHASKWRGALQRSFQSCWGNTGGVGSGVNQKLGKMIWSFLSGRGQRKHSGPEWPLGSSSWLSRRAPDPGASGAKLQVVRHSQSCTFEYGLSPPGKGTVSNSHQGTIWTSSSHGALNAMAPYSSPHDFPQTMNFLRTGARTDPSLCLQCLALSREVISQGWLSQIQMNLSTALL